MPSSADRSPGRPGARTPGQRAGVSAAGIVGVARRVADREGAENVTMRRLAAELGVAPNALYTYFPNKTAILDAVLDEILGEIVPPRLPEGSWQEELAALMRASWRTLLAHPHLVPLFIARPGGTNALRLGEAALRLLERGGVRGPAAAEAIRALLVYTLGSAAVVVPRAADPEGDGRLARASARIEELPAGEAPLTRSLAGHIASHPGAESFEAGLRWLLAGIASEAPPR